MKLAQVEAMLNALGATGTGVGEQTRGLGQRLPQALQTDLKQLAYIGQRVVNSGLELDPFDTQRFETLAQRVVATLEQVQASTPVGSGNWAPDSAELPVWGYFTDGLKRYADFSSRARRREYWMFTLFHGLGGLILFILAVVANSFSDDSSDAFSPLAHLFLSFLRLYIVLTFVPHVAVLVRRLHDQGSSGWLTLMCFVGLGVVVVVLTMLDSKPGTNKWGPNPKGVNAPSTVF
jgi:uncharacterized membrane protein YhaH (DUF805 family)